ncbi:hypothetical protein M422DRAFT_268560 [Sphaerobolus stellatus SS14]|uniref:Hydrophobin n=1 Tax=Sphaerobolus stellatus (strain SS14) TaxID=990650 RepID=A0A0C9U6U6_SPHS4|nr:hypothetical protein M422DRAFT_268560 [Sphaerobolus stellatus SS14]
MFSKIAILSFVSVLAAATQTIPVTYPIPTPTTISQCNTGEANCCNSVGQANILPSVSAILALLGIDLDPITAIVGLGCTPITVVGAGGVNCAQQPACCANNSFNGLINIGCVPVSL